MSTRKSRTSAVRTESSFSSTSNREDSFGLNNSGSFLENSRAQEKEQLTGLNSRLAQYIERVRQLEQENNRLTVQIRDVEVVEKKERTGLVDRFENEKKRLRAVIDDLEKREARAVIERDATVAEHDRLLSKVAKLERDLAKESESKMAAWAISDEATSKLKNLQAKLEKVEADNKDLVRENNRLSNQLASSQKALEDECLQRTVAQNELARAIEDLTFQKQQHASALEEVSRKRQVDMTTYQKQISQEYQSKFKDQLAEMRAQLQDQLDSSQYIIQEQYKNQLNDAQELRDKATAEVAKMKSRLKELEYNESTSGSIIEGLRKELRELKDQMEDRLADKDARINELNREISRLLTEFTNLRDLKIQLDSELEAYRVMLESEEQRLNLSADSHASVSRSSFTATSSAQRGRKRARIEFDGDTDVDFHRTKERLQKETTGPVGIEEVDEEGNWVRIQNYSDEDILIAKWILAVRTSEREVTYKFNPKMKLPANTSCTVYSAGTGKKTQMPDTIVMKSESWPIGANPSARLIDAEGDTVSTVTLEESESTDPSDAGDRCSIM